MLSTKLSKGSARPNQMATQAKNIVLHNIFFIGLDSKFLHTMFLINQIYDTQCSLYCPLDIT